MVKDTYSIRSTLKGVKMRCPRCIVFNLTQIKQSSASRIYSRALLHDSVVVCPNLSCGYRFDLSHDDYLFRLVTTRQLLSKPRVLSVDELKWSNVFLSIYAGYNKDFADYIGFNNFSFLIQHKISLKNVLYPNTNKEPEELVCARIFFRETYNLVAQKLGFKHGDDLLRKLDELVVLSKKLDRDVRRIMKKIIQIDYPQTRGEMVGKDYLVHVHY